MDAPLDPQLSVGRIFTGDWTISHVAKLLRFQAAQGTTRAGTLTRAAREMNQDYLRRTAARHVGSGVAVTFRRDETLNWHAELCFADLEHYLPWNQVVAEEWLSALFLDDRPRVREIAAAGSVRRFEVSAQ